MFAMAFAMQHPQPFCQHPNRKLRVHGNENRTQALTTGPPNNDDVNEGGDDDRQVTKNHEDKELGY